MANKKKNPGVVESILLRGVALIEAVIKRIQSGESQIEIVTPRPFSEEQIESLCFSNGAPLPPSIKRLLAFDTSWIRRHLSWNLNESCAPIQVDSVARVVNDNISDIFATAYQPLPPQMPAARAISLDVGCDSMRMLFLGKVDDYGEYPVIWVDVDDEPSLGLEAPGFDVWFAERDGLVSDTKIYKSDRKIAAKNNLGGSEYLTAVGYKDDVDLDACEGDINARPIPQQKTKPDGITKQNSANPIVEESKAGEKTKSGTSKAKKNTASSAKDNKFSGYSETKLYKAWVEAREIFETEEARVILDELINRFGTSQTWKDKALAEAADDDSPELVTELLSLGADPNHKNEDPPVVMAARAGNVAMVEALLKGGANIESRGFVSEGTPLIFACDQKHIDMVKFLLERGADPNEVDENEMGPIHHASHVFDRNPEKVFPTTVEIVRTLLDHGATIDAADGNLRTALHWAIGDRNRPLVEFLLSKGANPNHVQWAGDSALQQAWREGLLDIFRLISAHGARRDIKNKDKWCLNDFVLEDGVTPKVFDVDLRLTEKPQLVELHVAILVPNAYNFQGFFFDNALNFLVEIVNGGIGGSDVFSPSSGQAKWVTPPPKAKTKSQSSLVLSAEAVVEIGGLSPAGLGLWLRSLFSVRNGWRVSELRLVSKNPGVGNAIIVDSTMAENMIKSDEFMPIREFPNAPITVSKVSSKSRAAAVVLSGKGVGAESFAAVHSAWTVVFPEAGYGLGLMPPTKKGETIEFAIFGDVKQAPIPPAHSLTQGQAILVNAATRVQAKKKVINRLEWSFGVPITQAAIEAYTDQFSDTDRLEISPSGRATCRTCKNTIAKGEIRFVETYELGERYHHAKCSLKYHAKRLLKALKAYPDTFDQRETLEAEAVAKTSPKPAAAQGGANGVKYPYAEKAKTARSLCMDCNKNIAKDSWRVAVSRMVEIPGGSVEKPGYLHIGCAKDHSKISLESILENSNFGDDDKKDFTKTFG